MNKLPLTTPVEEVFSVRAIRALKGAGVAAIGELAEVRESALYRQPNFGRGSMREVNNFMATQGINRLPWDECRPYC